VAVKLAQYFAHVTDMGPVRYGRYPFSIGVLQAADNFMPFGMASQAGRTEDGLALWRLSENGADVPGRWVIVDREFRVTGDSQQA
jgi:hypothetical protein